MKKFNTKNVYVLVNCKHKWNNGTLVYLTSAIPNSNNSYIAVSIEEGLKFEVGEKNLKLSNDQSFKK